MKRCAIAFLTILAAFINLGCGTGSAIPRVAAGQASLPPPVLLLESGDVLEIRFLYWPELDQTQMIRPDGKISLAMISEVRAAGLTPEQLDSRLTELYAGQLKSPDITVIVRTLVSQRIYVGGEVYRPGLIPLQGDMTVMEAIMAAGGFDKRSAQMRNVVVVRRDGEKMHAVTMDLRPALSSSVSQSFYLAPHDIVFVPRTRIDAVDQWVEQYISRVVPTTVLNYSHKLSSETSIGYGTE